MLTLALDSGSERLSSLRLNPTAQARSTADNRDSAPNPIENPEGEELRSGSGFADRDDLDIARPRRAALTGLRTRIADRLPAVLEEPCAH